MNFKEDFSLDRRKSESDKIMLKYPSRIPIIVEKGKGCEFNDIDKKKYLVPKDMNMNQFIYVVRRRISLEPSQSLFLLVNNQLCSSNVSLFDIYEKHADKDGFLYIKYSSENTFG